MCLCIGICVHMYACKQINFWQAEHKKDELLICEQKRISSFNEVPLIPRHIYWMCQQSFGPERRFTVLIWHALIYCFFLFSFSVYFCRSHFTFLGGYLSISSHFSFIILNNILLHSSLFNFIYYLRAMKGLIFNDKRLNAHTAASQLQGKYHKHA